MNLYLIPSVLAPETAMKCITPQIFDVVKNVDTFLVEELRTARRYISSLKTGVVIDNLNFEILDKGTKQEIIEPFLAICKAKNKDVGVISEAGCPGVADPGAVAVKIAHKLGIKVVPLVGPSAILMALMGSGFSGQSFAFSGYLPISKADRLRGIQNLERLATQTYQTQIFMETPFRNNHLLTDILATCHANTKLCIAADITGTTEFIQTKTIENWRKSFPDLNKMPTIFLFGNS
jgi:16S rRNA (cytidine1402-2'-O)-methyltransferase